MVSSAHTYQTALSMYALTTGNMVRWPWAPLTNPKLSYYVSEIPCNTIRAGGVSSPLPLSVITMISIDLGTPMVRSHGHKKICMQIFTLIGVDFAAYLLRKIICYKIGTYWCKFYYADPLQKAHNGSDPCEHVQKVK